MDRILKWSGVIFLVLLCIACSHEEIEELHFPTSDDFKGQFVVEYNLGVADGVSRSIQENLPPNQRIHSLYYLLYSNEGVLKKSVRVPDINDQTEWPLTLEKMNWNQRQALKDTLMVDCDYTAVIIANVNPNDEAELLHKESLSKVGIKLPAVAYQNHTMPYIWKSTFRHTLVPGEDSREHPLKKDVRLQRLLSRLDISVAPVASSSIPFTAEFETQLRAELARCLNASLDKIKNEDVDWWKVSVKQEEYVDRLKAHITSEGYLSQIYARMPLGDIFNAIEKDREFQQRNHWTDFTDFAVVVHQPHNFFPLKTLSSQYVETVQSTVYDCLQKGRATWLGFSGNDSGAPTNRIKEIKLRSAKEELSIPISNPYTIILRKNECRSLVCNPATSVAASAVTWGGKTNFTCSLESIYGEVGALIDQVEPKISDVGLSKTRTKIINTLKQHLHYPSSPNIPGIYTFTIPIPTTFIYTATLQEGKKE